MRLLNFKLNLLVILMLLFTYPIFSQTDITNYTYTSTINVVKYNCDNYLLIKGKNVVKHDQNIIFTFDIKDSIFIMNHLSSSSILEYDIVSCDTIYTDRILFTVERMGTFRSFILDANLGFISMFNVYYIDDKPIYSGIKYILYME